MLAEARRAGFAVAAAVVYAAEYRAEPDVQGPAAVIVYTETDVSSVLEHLQNYVVGRGPNVCEPHSQLNFAGESVGHLDHRRLHWSAELPRNGHIGMLQHEFS